jgi:hypothetical protein
MPEAESGPWLLILMYEQLKRSACTQFAETKYKGEKDFVRGGTD